MKVGNRLTLYIVIGLIAGIIIGIDRLLDMTRTAVNITGDAAIASVLNEQQNRKEERGNYDT